MQINLPNLVATGIFNTDVAMKKNITVSKNRKTTMFEIELPIEKGGVSYIEDEHADIIPDMLICVKPGQTRHTRLPFKCYYVHIVVSDEYLKNLLFNIPNFVFIKNREYYLALFKDISYYHDTGYEADNLKVQSLILNLIHSLVEESKIKQYNGKQNNSGEAVSKTLQYIDENLTSDLSLETISSYVGFSPIHFHNLFKSATGKTLHDYVEERRIKKSTNMLISTDKTLTEIAYDCGFSSQSYFSYAFKRRMKCTPREYVKNFYKRYET